MTRYWTTKAAYNSPSHDLWKTIKYHELMAQQQLTLEEALETQTLVCQRTRNRGWGIQCKVIKKNGERCGAWAISGGYVCIKHGGTLQTVRRAAEARKMALAYRAISVIWDCLQPDTPPAIRLRAAKYALRFSGIDPGRIRSSRAVELPQRAIEAPKSDIDAEIESILFSLREIEQ